MPTRTLLLAALMLSAWTVAASARDLTVVMRDESMLKSVQKVLVQPFVVAADDPVSLGHWPGGLDALRAQLKDPNNTWDVVELNSDELAAACADGSLEKLDWSAIGGKEHYLPQALSDCGVGASLNTTVLAWDHDKMQSTPTWADFWDVAKYPGKRGLFKGVRGNLEFALMADGVAPADVYKTLGSNEGVDRAFRKLDQLKPYIVWWQNSTDAAHILSSGDVLMTTAPAGRIVTAGRDEHRNFGIQWAASLYHVESWAVVKNSANLRQAVQFLYFAGMPAVESRLFAAAGLAGLARGANDALPPELQALSPTNPTNLGAALKLDTAFWHDNQAKLRQRFDTWIDGH